MRELKCECCGEPFARPIFGARRRRFCSETCRKRAERARWRARRARDAGDDQSSTEGE